MELFACGNNSVKCVISGFCSHVDDTCALVEYYALQSGKSSTTFRENLSAPSSRVKKSNSLTPEDGTYSLSPNFVKDLPLNAA